MSELGRRLLGQIRARLSSLVVLPRLYFCSLLLLSLVYASSIEPDEGAFVMLPYPLADPVHLDVQTFAQQLTS